MEDEQTKEVLNQNSTKFELVKTNSDLENGEIVDEQKEDVKFDFMGVDVEKIVNEMFKRKTGEEFQPQIIDYPGHIPIKGFCDYEMDKERRSEMISDFLGNVEIKLPKSLTPFSNIDNKPTLIPLKSRFGHKSRIIIDGDYLKDLHEHLENQKEVKIEPLSGGESFSEMIERLATEIAYKISNGGMDGFDLHSNPSSLSEHHTKEQNELVVEVTTPDKERSKPVIVVMGHGEIPEHLTHSLNESYHIVNLDDMNIPALEDRIKELNNKRVMGEMTGCLIDHIITLQPPAEIQPYFEEETSVIPKKYKRRKQWW